jgi:hypothetical protein
MRAEILQAFGAAENREALASLMAQEKRTELEEPPAASATDEFLEEPPEVQPVVPPMGREEAVEFVDEKTPPAAADDEAPVEPPEIVESAESFEAVAAVEEELPPAESFVESAVEVEAEPDDLAVADEAPHVAEPAASRDAFADDPISRAEPFMVGFGDPFADEDAAEVSEVLPKDSSLAVRGSAIGVTAEDNQLHLQLRGSGAIAEMGQVRALDIEVPVPGQWVGNRKVTLQLRLTLTPAEDENG